MRSQCIRYHIRFLVTKFYIHIVAITAELLDVVDQMLVALESSWSSTEKRSSNCKISWYNKSWYKPLEKKKKKKT